MSENDQLEEDIWEYKSIRKPKSVSQNNLVNIYTSVQKANDGNCKSKRSGGRNKKKPSENQDKSKKSEQGPRQKDIQPLIIPDQSLNLSKDDYTVQTPECATTPVKQSRICNKKQTPPNARPVYDGWCPSCQMPFSLLLAQTPRWHVTDCLDTPGSIEKECPDGLLCNSTIPSHYKRYTHFILATSRAGDYLVDSSTYNPERTFMSSDVTNSSCFSGFVDGTSQHEKLTRNVRNVSNEDPILVIQNSTQPKSPNLTNLNTTSSTNVLKPQKTLLLSQSADDSGQLKSWDFPFSQGSEASGDLDCQNASNQKKLLLPETVCSDCEISYSPLNTDEENEEETEEEEEKEEKVKKSQKRLFHTQNSDNESTKKEDSSSLWFTNLGCSPLHEEPKYSCLKIGSFIIQNEPCVELKGLSNLDGFVNPVSQDHMNSMPSNSGSTDNQLKHPQVALTAESSISLNYDITKKEFDWPKLSASVSNTGNWELKDIDACHLDSADLAVDDPSLSLKVKEEGGRSFLSRQSEVSKKPSYFIINKMTTNASGNAVYQKRSQPVTEKKESLPSTAAVPLASTVSKTQSLGFFANMKPKSVSAKELKQMDIGVFFGLKPKAKEENTVEKHFGEGTQASSPVIPNGKRPRLRKRKAEGSVGDIDAVPESSKKDGVCADTTSGGQRSWRKRFKALSSTEEGTKNKKCPFYKKIPGTGFTVDAFQYGEIEGCTAYFLTHFHSDHYSGLTKKFTFPIYCNKVTGNLVKSKLQVQEQYIHILPMDTECIVNGIKVVLLDANHCPGATMILFCLPNGTVILHTGDFRADPFMERYPLLMNRRIHTLYLDTTYCSPEYTFPSQQEVIQFAINTAFETVTLNPRTLVVCGTYTIGKEKVFLAIAQVLGSKVSMSPDKYKTLQCLESAAVNSLITVDWNNTLLHLLPMMQINFKGLQNHLNKFSEKFDQVLAFRPTGWTYSNSCHAVIKPQTRGKITIYGIPYSEHSSYLEMKRFVQWLKPQKIIPTVNVGDWRARSMMEKHFRDWKMEPTEQKEEFTSQRTCAWGGIEVSKNSI
uniref:DNA cross-link repair 1A protein n=1 Tax=Pelodiscus sinensis TaxID=13735 RepID=K7GDX2_PELSI|nr:DNA cross-link repair 1A protein isoform X1 [Pelodiscus sinensis]|eukprot:XP_006135033.1 DNA cross-link repair 1A protein isoform X1 [Pelodiscus sinensis]